MKKCILLVIVLATFIACDKKELKVPKVAMQGEEEIQNNTAIWMFYGENGKVEVNEKNRISSTNWFFNIDKKLTLNEVIPEVIRLVSRHNKKSPHNTKSMSNYFTYINSINNHLSFHKFDSINYKILHRNELRQFSGDTLALEVDLSILELPDINKNTIIQPIFNSEITFQKYMEAKALLNKKEKGKVSNIEYIILP